MASSNFIIEREKEQRRSIPDAARFLLGLIAALGIGMRLRNLTTSYVWLDEMFSLEAARLTLGDLFSFVVQDVVHPPLFYTMLKVWVAVGGDSLLWVRLFPFLISVAALIPFIMLCRELRLGVAETNTALMLVSVNGFLIYYSQEVRMYSPLFFFSVCSLWLFTRYLNNTENALRKLFVLGIVNLALVYTHYYGWLLVATQFVLLMLWDRRKFKPFLWMLSVLGLLFAPWAYAVGKVLWASEAGLGHNLAWLSQPSAYRVLSLYSTFTGSFEIPHRVLIGSLLFGLPVIFWAWCRLVEERQNKTEAIAFRILVLFAFLPTLTLFIASKMLSNPVWLPRGLIVVGAAFLVLVAVAVNRMPNEWLKGSMLLLILGWATLSGINETNKLDYRKIAWNTLGQHIAQSEPSDASRIRIYALDRIPAYSLQFYFNQVKEQRFEIVTAEGQELSKPGIDPFFLKQVPAIAVDDLRDLKEDHFWLLFIEEEWPQSRTPQDVLSADGFTVGESLWDQTKQICVFPVWRKTEVTQKLNGSIGLD